LLSSFIFIIIIILSRHDLSTQFFFIIYSHVIPLDCSYDMRHPSPVLVRCGSSNESVVKMEWCRAVKSFTF
jgi:hypothetical protein